MKRGLENTASYYPFELYAHLLLNILVQVIRLRTNYAIELEVSQDGMPFHSVQPTGLAYVEFYHFSSEENERAIYLSNSGS
uniref:Uncharacterized protein n=1 Tax=Timema tahoe TaxID=61484 RepID=A0A7R9NZC7_9NEOP|nr:unnamed protein product [Timema tahoe]